MKTEIYLILLITFLRVFENPQKIETQRFTLPLLIQSHQKIKSDIRALFVFLNFP